jgi:hypothetical protein
MKMRLAFLGPLLLIAAASPGSAHEGDPNFVHACVNSVNGNTRIVESTETCKNNETPFHWPKQIPTTPTDPVVLGRIGALESQVLSLQQEVENLTEFTTPPGISINDTSFVESCSGTSTAISTVSLTKPTQFTVYADYSTRAGTASASYDFLATSGTLAFAPGDTVKTIPVTVYCDASPELDESFYIDLSNVVFADVIDATGEVDIVNDDLAQVSIEIDSAASFTLFRSCEYCSSVIVIDEGSAVTFKVYLYSTSPYVVDVDYSIVGVDLGNPDAFPTDDDDVYPGASGTLTFLPGEQQKTITITTVDDQAAEGLEGMAAVISNPVNATIVSASQPILLNDDDVSLTLTATPQSVTEGTVPLTAYQSMLPSESSVELTLSLSQPVEGGVYARLFMDSATSEAIPVRNYVVLGYGSSYGYYGWVGDIVLGSFATGYSYARIVQIPPGETSLTLTLPLLSDDIPEATETAVIEAESIWGAVPGNGGIVEIEILDDD